MKLIPNANCFGSFIASFAAPLPFGFLILALPLCINRVECISMSLLQNGDMNVQTCATGVCMYPWGATWVRPNQTSMERAEKKRASWICSCLDSRLGLSLDFGKCV